MTTNTTEPTDSAYECGHCRAICEGPPAASPHVYLIDVGEVEVEICQNCLTSFHASE
jgi:hypothetical protein